MYINERHGDTVYAFKVVSRTGIYVQYANKFEPKLNAI